MSAAARAEERESVDILLEQLSRFLAQHIDALEIDRSGVIPPAVLKGLADLGVFALSIPVAYEGAGFSLDAVCRVVALVAQYDRSVATTVGLHLGLGTRAIIAYGDEALKAEVLPKMARGEWIASFAATEANAGSDLTAIATTGISGDECLIVDGAKAYVTNAGFAHVFTLLVATPGLGGARSHSLICVTRDSAGLTFGAEEDKLGLRGSSTCPMFLDGVRLARSRIIGPPGEGMDLVYRVLAWGRTTMAAGCLGAARAAMIATIEQATQREQFGKALADLPVVREQLTTMSSLLFTLDALVRHTAACEGDEDVLARRSTAAKIFASETDWEIADTCLQLHGGSGFLEDTGVAMLLRDARITRIFEGANDVLRTHLGGHEVAAPMARVRLVEQYGPDPLASSADALADEIEQWVADVRGPMGARLLRRHRLLHRIGSAVVLREATDAVVSQAIALDDPVANAQALHWIELAQKRLVSIYAESAPDDRLELVVNALRAGTAPM